MSLIKRIREALLRPPPSPPDTPAELWSPELGDDYRSFWDNMARDKTSAYLAVAGKPFGEMPTEESLSEHGKATAEAILRTLEIGPSDSVLEVGVGVGRIAEHIAPSCRHFTGLDISTNMIKLARERLKNFSNITLLAHQQSDLSPFPDAAFTRIFFQVVLIHLDREDAFHYLRESYRVLSAGGRGWFQFYNLLHPRGLQEFKFAVDYMVEKGRKTRGRVHCYTAPEVRCLVEAAGFRILEDRSALAMVNQAFPFSPPDADWESYLIAVGEKPADG